MKRISFYFVLGCLVLSLLACSISVNLTETPEPIAPPTSAPEMMATATTQPEPSATADVKVPEAKPTTGATITVYFTNEARFNVGTEPYEDAVTRPLPEGVAPARAVLDALFAGPTPEEYTAGLRLFSSGFTHVRQMTVENGIARVYLGGVCANNGAAYSVGAVIMKNLEQFPEITAVKIYDEYDSNLDPDSSWSSLPYCLEP